MALNYGVSTLESWNEDSDILIGIGTWDKLDDVVLAAGQGILTRGTCLAKKTVGTAAPDVTVGNVIGTGNGVLTLADTPYGTGIQEGVYKVIVTEGTVDAVSAVPYSAGPPEVQQVEAVAAKVGAFIVEKPDGTIEATGKIGTAYNKSIKFTLADGATNFIAGDLIEITVDLAAGTNQFWKWDTNQTDGREKLLGILGETTDTTNGTEKAWRYISGKFNKDICVAGHTIAAGVHNNPDAGTIIFLGEQ